MLTELQQELAATHLLSVILEGKFILLEAFDNDQFCLLMADSEDQYQQTGLRVEGSIEVVHSYALQNWDIDIASIPIDEWCIRY